jgi:IS30 family transposase
MVAHITNKLSHILSGFIKTLVFDNDKAFARHQQIGDQLQAVTYFT